jgi:hypothetical protein
MLTDIHVETAQRNAADARQGDDWDSDGGSNGNISVHVLPWGDAEAAQSALCGLGAAPDVLLGGDVIYGGFDLDALLATIQMLSSPRTLVLMSYHQRSKDTTVGWERGLSRRGFRWRRVPYGADLVDALGWTAHTEAFATNSPLQMWIYVVSVPSGVLPLHCRAAEEAAAWMMPLAADTCAWDSL